MMTRTHDKFDAVGQVAHPILLSRTGTWLAHITAITFACTVGAIFYLLVLDREPPWTRLWGTIEPTHAGDLITPHWSTTPFARACPGTLQIEIISPGVSPDGAPYIWPVLSRPLVTDHPAGATEWVAPPWPLSKDAPPNTGYLANTDTIYRVTSFWYCNKLQKLVGVPIVQVGPDIHFKVLPAQEGIKP